MEREEYMCFVLYIQRHLEKSRGCCLLHITFPLPRPLFLKLFLPYSRSMLFHSIFCVLSTAKKILLSFTFYNLLKNKNKNETKPKNNKDTMLSKAIYATPLLFTEQLRSTHGDNLQYYFLILRLVNICTSHHFQTINSQNRKYKVGNLFFQFQLCILNMKLNRY